MVPEPVCTTAIANNATISIIINNKKKIQETLARLIAVCWGWEPGAGGWGGGAKPSSVLFGGCRGALPCWGTLGTLEQDATAVGMGPPPAPSAVQSLCAVGKGVFP